MPFVDPEGVVALFPDGVGFAGVVVVGLLLGCAGVVEVAGVPLGLFGCAGVAEVVSLVAAGVVVGLGVEAPPVPVAGAAGAVAKVGGCGSGVF